MKLWALGTVCLLYILHILKQHFKKEKSKARRRKKERNQCLKFKCIFWMAAKGEWTGKE